MPFYSALVVLLLWEEVHAHPSRQVYGERPTARRVHYNMGAYLKEHGFRYVRLDPFSSAETLNLVV